MGLSFFLGLPSRGGVCLGPWAHLSLFSENWEQKKNKMLGLANPGGASGINSMYARSAAARRAVMSGGGQQQQQQQNQQQQRLVTGAPTPRQQQAGATASSRMQPGLTSTQRVMQQSQAVSAAASANSRRLPINSVAATNLRSGDQSPRVDKIEALVAQLEGLVQAQADEIVQLREELEIAALGSLNVQGHEEVPMYAEATAESVLLDTMAAGESFPVYYPFVMNEAGLWGTCKKIEIAATGLLVSGGYVLLGRADPERPESMEALVEILKHTHQ